MLNAIVSEFGPLEWLMTGSIFIVPLFTHVYFGMWVYRNAEARGMEDRTLWLLLVLFTGIIGLIIYSFVRPPKRVVNQNFKNTLLIMGVLFNVFPIILYFWIRTIFWNFNVLGILLITVGLKFHLDKRRLEREVIL